MRPRIRTSYAEELNFFPSTGSIAAYVCAAIVMLALPFLLAPFWLTEFAYVFILAIIGAGLMMLTGFTGQVSLGHAAIVGIGSYTHAILLSLGVPFVPSVAITTVFCTVIGGMLGFPILRLNGIYLAMATLSFAIIVETVFVKWESMTGGFSGLPVADAYLAGDLTVTDRRTFYYITLVSAVVVFLGCANILRSRTGRAFIAIRDSEVAAECLGVKLAAYKTLAFALSAGVCGFAGALLAHHIGYLSPDAFGILLAIQLLLMVVVGGLGTLQGAVLGAIFIGAVPQWIALMRQLLPSSIGHLPGLEPALFGFILVGFILFEPTGLYGRWVKIRQWLASFPLVDRKMFKSQRSYMKAGH